VVANVCTIGTLFQAAAFDGQANGLGFSGGAPRDQESIRADPSLQNGSDLVGAKRRPL
jgi:hypothetical protein